MTFLFRAGRRDRLARGGEVPTEFFYGYVQLKAKGVDVRYLEDADVGIGPPLALSARLLSKASRVLGNLPIGMIISLIISGGGKRLNDAGIIVATTNNMGLTLAFSRAMGIVKAPVLFMAMGLLPERPGRLKRGIYAWLLRHLHVACISKSEQAYLQSIFPGQPVDYLPFGVDARFWEPNAGAARLGYALAIGNDRNRDWATLVSAWNEDLPILKVVTSLPVPSGAPNIEVIKGDWRSQILSDESIRALYQGAKFVIVPLHDTIQPAGQSVCLQAMACGKAVILTDIKGLWDRDLIVNGCTVLLTPAGDAKALSDNAKRLVYNTQLANQLGSAGRRLVETHFNIEGLSQSLLGLAQRLGA